MGARSFIVRGKGNPEAFHRYVVIWSCIGNCREPEDIPIFVLQQHDVSSSLAMSLFSLRPEDPGSLNFTHF